MEESKQKQTWNHNMDSFKAMHPEFERLSHGNDVTALRNPRARRRSSHLRRDELDTKVPKNGDSLSYGFGGSKRWKEKEKSDPLMEGKEKFSDILMKTSSTSSTNNFSISGGSKNLGMHSSKPGSHSNQSSISLHSHRKTASSLLGLPPLRRDISGASHESSHTPYSNSLVRQFLESASKSGQACDVMTNVFYSQDCISHVSECIGSENVDLSTMLASQLGNAKLSEIEATAKDFIIPEYHSLDYCEFITNELASIETRLKFYLTKRIIPKEQSNLQSINQLEKFSMDLAKLSKQITIMKGQIKFEYLKDMEIDFSRNNNQSFMNRFEELVTTHLGKLEALETRLYECRYVLDKKKLQLRKLENLIKFTDMVNDFKRNMKFSQKFKEYYGVMGDFIFALVLLFLLADIYRRWIV